MDKDQLATSRQWQEIKTLGIRVPAGLRSVPREVAARLIAEAKGQEHRVAKQRDSAPAQAPLHPWAVVALVTIAVLGIGVVWSLSHPRGVLAPSSQDASPSAAESSGPGAIASSPSSSASGGPKNRRSARLDGKTTLSSRRGTGSSFVSEVNWTARISTFGKENFPAKVEWYILGKDKTGQRTVLQQGVVPSRVVPHAEGPDPLHEFASGPVKYNAKNPYKLEGWVMFLRGENGEELATATNVPEGSEWMRLQKKS